MIKVHLQIAFQKDIDKSGTENQSAGQGSNEMADTMRAVSCDSIV